MILEFMPHLDACIHVLFGYMCVYVVNVCACTCVLVPITVVAFPIPSEVSMQLQQ